MVISGALSATTAALVAFASPPAVTVACLIGCAVVFRVESDYAVRVGAASAIASLLLVSLLRLLLARAIFMALTLAALLWCALTSARVSLTTRVLVVAGVAVATGTSVWFEPSVATSELFALGAESSSTIPLPPASAPPASPPPVPPPPSPPPTMPPPMSPPSCLHSCITRACLSHGYGNSAQTRSTLHAIVRSALAVPAAVQSTVDGAMAALGPKGTFMRDAWPVLLGVAVVAAVSLASLAWPLLAVAASLCMTFFGVCYSHFQHLRRLLQPWILLALVGAIGEDAYNAHVDPIHRQGYLRAAIQALLAAPFLAAAIYSFGRPARGARDVGEVERRLQVTGLLVAAMAATLVAAAFAATAAWNDDFAAIAPDASGEELLSHASAHKRRRRRVWGWLGRDRGWPLTRPPRMVSVAAEGDNSVCCAPALMVMSGLCGWAALGLLAEATRSATLAALASMPLVVGSALVRTGWWLVCAGWRLVCACARVFVHLSTRLIVRPMEQLTLRTIASLRCGLAIARRRLRSVLGTALVLASCALLADRQVLSFAPPMDMAPQCQLAWRHLIAARVFTADPLPLHRLGRALLSAGGPCAGSVTRSFCAIVALAGGLELFGGDWQAAALSQALSGPMAKLYHVLKRPLPPTASLARDGISPCVLGALIVQLNAGQLLAQAPTPREVPIAKADVHAASDSGAWREVGAGLVLMLAGAWTCWTSPLAFMKAGRRAIRRAVGFTIQCGKLAFTQAWRLAEYLLGLIEYVAKAIANGAIRLWACLMRLTSAVHGILSRLTAATYGMISRVASAVFRVIARLTATTYGMISRVASAVFCFTARHARGAGRVMARVAWQCSCVLEAGVHALLRAASWLAVRVARGAAHAIRAIRRALSFVWDAVIKPIYSRLVQPTAMAAARHWPALSCALVVVESALFLRAAGLAAVALLTQSHWSLTSPLMELLPAAAALLGSSATASVGLVLAGHGLGSGRLTELGSWCIVRVDFGAVHATLAVLRAAASLVHTFLSLLTNQLHRLRALITGVLGGALRLGIVVTLFVWHRLVATLAFLGALAARLLLAPLRRIWRSPLTAFLASLLALGGTYQLHQLGAWQPIVETTVALPGLMGRTLPAALISTLERLTSPLSQLAGTAAAAAHAPVSRLSPTVGSAVAATWNGLHGASEAQLDAIESAFTSATALHAHPPFGLLIWALVVALVKLSPAVPPPRALAAAELVIVGVFSRASAARLLPIALLLGAVYLHCSAQVAARAGHERRRALQVLAARGGARRRAPQVDVGRWQVEYDRRILPRIWGRRAVADGRRMSTADPKALVAALAAEPLPETVFTAEDCIICLEPLIPMQAHASAEGAGGAPAAASAAAEWSCAACTFRNPEAAQQCSMCETAREAPRAETVKAVSTLRCGHAFHAECVAEWIRKTVHATPRCPTCVQPISLTRVLLEGMMGVE